MNKVIDVTNWRLDETHGHFPVGAREKSMLWSPDEPIEGIKPNWPYLFKLSNPRYPDQFWAEVIAYEIGKKIGYDIPKCFVATRVDNDVSQAGALIEWFYDPASEKFIAAGDYIARMDPLFDDKKGERHCLQYMAAILRYFDVKHPALWVYRTLLFDAIIGNTDRHQENWGLVFYKEKNNDVEKQVVRPAPLFDNGTSLGHEYDAARALTFDEGKIIKYIERGCNHLRLKPDSSHRIKHYHISKLGVSKLPYLSYEALKNMSFICENIDDILSKYTDENYSVVLSKDRAKWISKLVKARVASLKAYIMNVMVNNIVEPNRLMVTWQPAEGGSRYIIGFIENVHSETPSFSYTDDENEINSAKANGFTGHPAFRIDGKSHPNPIDVFMRRLPPRARPDFYKYLSGFGLPATFDGSNVCLLAYTGAKLPSDGFAILPDLETLPVPFDIILELAGTRYQNGLDFDNINPGDAVSFVLDNDNVIDPNAIAVFHGDVRVGFINRAHCLAMRKLLADNERNVAGVISKVYGSEERKIIMITLMVA
ncbi:TPA: HipA domain-containing protein [Aeromonas salmonicida]|nr:HipA domain-containing protein [Aeromonas salmonicida]